MSGNPSQEWMMLKLSNPIIEFVHKGNSPVRTIFCDELQNGKEIVLGNRKVAKYSFTGHSAAVAASSSSVGG